MHILVLLTDFLDAVGGIQTFNRSLIKVLDEIAEEKDYKLTILVLNQKQKSALERSYINHSKTSYQIFARNKFKFIIKSLLLSRQADLIVLGHINFSSLAIFMKVLNNKAKFFLIIYGMEVWYKLSIVKQLALIVINNIISVCKHAREQLLKNNKLSQSRFFIIPCTLDPLYGKVENVSKSSTILKLPEGKVILTVSRLDIKEPFKGIDRVIKSMQLVLKQIPDSLCVIVGDGTARSSLEQLACDCKVDNRVLFVGAVSDDILSIYYQSCDIFVLPHPGIVFLEAMYYSKPIVSTNDREIPEIVEDGKTGLLCEPNNVSALATSMITLLSDKKLRYSLGNAGRIKFENEFTIVKFKDNVRKALAL